MSNDFLFDTDWFSFRDAAEQKKATLAAEILAWLEQLGSEGITYNQIRSDFLSRIGVKEVDYSFPDEMDRQFFGSLRILDHNPDSWPNWMLKLLELIGRKTIGEMARQVRQWLEEGIIYFGIGEAGKCPYGGCIEIGRELGQHGLSCFLAIPLDFHNEPLCMFDIYNQCSEIIGVYSKVTVLTNPAPAQINHEPKFFYPEDGKTMMINYYGTKTFLSRFPNIQHNG